MKTLSSIAIGISISLILCASPFFASAADEKFISIATAVPGGTFYVLGIGMADVINKELKDKNYHATAITTGGALENARLLGEGKVQVGLNNVGTHSKAYLGRKPFNKEYKNLTKGFGLGVYIFHILTTEKTGIKTVYDLRGKTVSFGTSGSIVQTVGKYVLTLHGIDVNDVKMKNIGPAEAVDALMDGIIDAFAQYSVIPSPAVNMLAARAKPVIVACDREKLKEAQETERYLSTSVPAGAYKGVDVTVPALGVVGTVDFNKNDGTEMVYDITKAILQNTEALKKVHPSGGLIHLMTKEEADTSPLPFHPGVLKYASEVGVKY
jgi:TRAP transporter TAXI family solute receptor